jgi:nicotinate-nucleotide pyrophosphorylase (carboxylating)
MIPIEDLVRFVDEDAPAGDVTTMAVVPDVRCSAVIEAKEKGIIAGLEESERLFCHFGVSVARMAEDGAEVAPGTTLLALEGPARAILLVERTALNIIGRMSGIATATDRIVRNARAVHPSVRVAATRKTCPGLGFLDKKAVMMGGGEPHRFSLSDQILIKDNHLSLVPLEEAINRAKAWSTYKLVEVEVQDTRDAITAARCGADILMLDNMGWEEVADTLEALAREGLKEGVIIEVSGGITEEMLPSYAALDVDIISMGMLTHSVRNFDVHLTIRKQQ